MTTSLIHIWSYTVKLLRGLAGLDKTVSQSHSNFLKMCWVAWLDRMGQTVNQSHSNTVLLYLINYAWILLDAYIMAFCFLRMCQETKYHSDLMLYSHVIERLGSTGWDRTLNQSNSNTSLIMHGFCLKHIMAFSFSNCVSDQVSLRFYPI